MTVLLILTLPLATGLGPVYIPPAMVAKIVGHHLSAGRGP